MKLSLSRSALEDLKGIQAYYKEQLVPEVGQNFVSAIIEHIETLKDYPDIGRKVPEFNEDHIRELIHPPFRIVYLRNTHSIQIIRVWRSERLLKLDDSDN